jgi:oligopeptide/dipeptide ABC transporter ATP-binding protein
MIITAGRAPLPGVGDRALVVRGLAKTFHLKGRGAVPAVLPTSLELRPKQSLGIVGESGSGKTTLARMICGLTLPTSGTVTFDGEPVDHRRKRPQRRGRIQMVFQDPYDSLNPRMLIEDAVKEPMLLAGRFDPREMSERAITMLERVQISREFLRRYPSQLSGGQLQRVCIARALSSNPELVVLDEPTSALDWMTRSEVLTLLNRLREDLDLTYLVISHDVSAISAVSDEVAVMYFGSVVERGPTREVVEHPVHPYTKMLMSSVLEPRFGASRERPKRAGPSDGTVHGGGCTFLGRCSHREAACSHTPQELRSVGYGREVACMRADGQGAIATEL